MAKSDTTKRPFTNRDEHLGQDHPHVVTTLNNLARLYCAQGKCGEAIPFYNRAIAIFDASLGPDHPNTKAGRRNLELCRETCEEA